MGDWIDLNLDSSEYEWEMDLHKDIITGLNSLYLKYRLKPEQETCPHCNGSGEGMHDGTTCSFCKGSGVEL